MSKYQLLLCFLYTIIIGCKCQDGKVDFIHSKNTESVFEEKQRKDSELLHLNSKDKLQGQHFTFREAAKKVISGVVHIKATYTNQFNQFSDPTISDFWRHFFSELDEQKYKIEASGVIVSSDGYIVTNDHVVENADDIEVILHNKKSYKAKIIGIDPDTDLALLKIQEKNLSFIEFGNSDNTEVGDWVIAVGNPFNLTSTVTSGIISAKARTINLSSKKGGIESYIQTDAAMNAGNSGGALVDEQGKLIGVNAAITTSTGAYAGYSFAIPINIVKKIIDDLLVNGKVRRGYLGMVLKDISENSSKQLSTNITNGVYVDSLLKGGAAFEANMQTKDIILAIGNRKVETLSQLQEVIAQYSPGEKMILTIDRMGQEKKIILTLKEYDGTEANNLIANVETLINLGIRIDELSEKEKNKFKLRNGLKINEILPGKINDYTTIKKGFIILKINDKSVFTIEDFIKVYLSAEKLITIEGTYANFPGFFYFTFPIK